MVLSTYNYLKCSSKSGEIPIFYNIQKYYIFISLLLKIDQRSQINFDLQKFIISCNQTEAFRNAIKLPTCFCNWARKMLKNNVRKTVELIYASALPRKEKWNRSILAESNIYCKYIILAIWAVVAEWLSSWLAEQEDRGSIPGLATWIFRDWLSPASKSRYGWNTAKSTEKHKLGRGHWDLASCQVSLNSIQRFQRRSRKMSQPNKSQGGHLVFPIGPKNTNLVEDIEILLPVKFRWIPFSGFRGEIENVSANQRPGRPSCFSDRPEKTQLDRGRSDLASCQVSLNSVQPFQRRSQKCLSQSEARAAILFFRSARKTQTW